MVSAPGLVNEMISQLHVIVAETAFQLIDVRNIVIA